MRAARGRHVQWYPSGVIEAKRRKQTGHVVSVVVCKQHEVDDDDGNAPYATICEEHSIIVTHRTQRLAMDHAASPIDWCEDCRAEKETVH